MTFTSASPVDLTPTTIHSHEARNIPWATGSVGSNAYPAANLAVFVPFCIAQPVLVYETWCETGTLTTSNNVEVGVYDTAFTRLFTSTMTVAVASSVVNSTTLTDFMLDDGTYYLAMGCDGTRNFLASTQAAGLYQASGCMEQTGLTGAALPSTATPVAYTRGLFPTFGLNLRSIAI